MRISESFEHQLRNIAKSMRDDFLEQFEDERRKCELCGIVELDIDGLPPHGRVEFYNVPCPMDGCNGTASVVRYVVETPPEIPYDKERMDGWRCTKLECTPDDSLAADAISGYDPHRTKEYQLPTTNLVKSRILKHHTSYDPERTIDVCYTCHGLIHSDSGVYADLVPVLDRSEAEQMGLVGSSGRS